MRSNAGIKRLDARGETSSELTLFSKGQEQQPEKGKIRDTILPISPNIKPRNWRKVSRHHASSKFDKP